MFSDVGPMELAALAVLAVLLFGPDRLPEVIQNVAGFLRKVREVTDSAEEEIRSGLGPEFQGFELRDLRPETFVRKHVLDGDALGLGAEPDPGADPEPGPAPRSASAPGPDPGPGPGPGPGGSSAPAGSRPGPEADAPRVPFDPEAT
ncbi:twin-arginine translocase TatA/TatE family subunit [Streptomyces sp. NPDC006349]|uniref:twin-arginine translocase TatA/TatE family subunit n=1 Tax=Streptomyces sp. NPDC006349 TaxID=3156757 RepID=UPI0033B5B18A